MSLLRQVAAAGALSTALLFGLAYSPVHAGYVVTLEEVGSDVVATGSGPLDLTGLSGAGPAFVLSLITPIQAAILTGPPTFNSFGVYTGITGPTSFGNGGLNDADNGGGDNVGVIGLFGQLYVPFGYVSGGPLSDTATYLNQTFGTLGVTPGTYIWNWGPGVNQNFTLIIGSIAAVPEPTSAALLGVALAGLLLAGNIRGIRRTS